MLLIKLWKLWILKYDFLIKRCEDLGIKKLNNLNAFREQSNSMDDVCENIIGYNTARKKN